MERGKLLLCSLLAASVLLHPPVAAQGTEMPVKLHPDLAKLLSEAQADLEDGKAQSAVDRLEGFRGEDHALRHLLLGHAHARQSNLGSAAAAYRKALALDGALAPAGIALAKVHVMLEEWTEAVQLLGRYVNVDSCEAEHLLLYAEVARKLNDGRLFSLLVREGLLRFPGDLRLRRLDLFLLSGRDDHEAASEAALYLLEKAPTDPALWQELAHSRGRAGDSTGRQAALEAGLLADPGDLSRHRQFFSALLAAGDWRTVTERGQLLLAGPRAKTAAADLNLMELLISAADRGERDEALGAWLDLIPEGARTRNMHLAAARRALRQGEAMEARKALGLLMESGDQDPSILLWAGHLAEKAKDWPEAEILYDQARTFTGPSAHLACLYLARLHLTMGSPERAEAVLRRYLDAHPEDAPARALLAIAEAKKDAPNEK